MKKYTNKNKLNENGQTLVETIVAIFILTTALSSGLALMIYAFSKSSISQDEVVATNLAREGIEVVRGIRDSNWLSQEDELIPCDDISSKLCYPNAFDGIPAGNHRAIFASNIWSLDSTPDFDLYIQNDGAYRSTPTSMSPTFARMINISFNTNAPYTAANPEMIVKSVVAWRDKNCPEFTTSTDILALATPCKIIVEEHLTNWKDYSRLTPIDPPEGFFVLTIIKDGTGNGTVRDNANGVDCGPTCQVTLPENTNVTLSAEPNPTSTFVQWSGGNCSGSGNCALIMDDDKTITASFAVESYNVEYLIVAGGGSAGMSGNTCDGGAGGAGGVVTGSTPTIVGNSYTMTVGSGGVSAFDFGSSWGRNGNNSSAFGFTAIGGGGGGGAVGEGPSEFPQDGSQGGSGGGGACGRFGGAGIAGQGFAGTHGNVGGGGGGAGGVGNSGHGGPGATVWGSAYGGGGGNGSGLGGTGGGGNGDETGLSRNGVPNTGGGGGTGDPLTVGGSGGSGIIIVRYPNAGCPAPPRGTGGVISCSNGFTYHRFNSTGTFIP